MEIQGFSFSAVEAGVRYIDRLDLGLIHADCPCVTAGVFTTNLVKAAPVILDIERLKNNQAQAILVNSGCANACTGDAGMEAALKTSSLLSTRLGLSEGLIQLSSTGVIGEPLNVAAFEDSMESLVSGLSAKKFTEVAKAIMTTDTVHKVAEATLSIGGKQVKILGMAKGAGMIMPNMATMLAFVCTDCSVESATLQKMLRAANARTFNRITIDGDSSTNDMVLVMANGLANNATIDETSPEEGQIFQKALEELLKDLALQIVSDGEGASKTITVRITGAATDEEAETLARTVATSSLVKTAFFGEDANWGRILAALGRAGVWFSPSRVKLSFGEVMLVETGLGLGKEAEDRATEVLKDNSFTVEIEVGEGTGTAELYTCDFSIDYVKINADYRS